MNRAVMVVSVVAAFALSGVAAASGVRANPPPPGTLCSFDLSPPVAGADVVTATLTPLGCAGAFRPHLSVVCIQRADTAPQCSQGRGTDTAQVSVPLLPGATYTSSGRGLGTLFNDMAEPNWQLLGPITAVL